MTTALVSVLQGFQSHSIAAAKRFEQTDGPIHRGVPVGELRIHDRVFTLNWVGASAAIARAIDEHYGAVEDFTAFDFYPPPSAADPIRVVYGGLPVITRDNGAYSITVTLQEF